MKITIYFQIWTINVKVPTSDSWLFKIEENCYTSRTQIVCDNSNHWQSSYEYTSQMLDLKLNLSANYEK